MGNRWSLQRTVNPTDFPVELSFVKKFARFDSDDNSQDDVLQALCWAATTFVETLQNRQLMPATYVFISDFFPSWELKVPMPPFQSVNNIHYLDTGGNSDALDSSLFLIDTSGEPGRITPAYSQIWPITRYQMSAVAISYQAGYAGKSSIPHTTRVGIAALVSAMNMNREAQAAEAIQNIPMYYDMLLSERVLDFSGPLGSGSNVPVQVSAWGGSTWWN